MAAKKKKAMLTERYLVTDMGAFRIISIDGKYYNCEDRRFLRSNPHIQRVEERPAPPAVPTAEPEAELTGEA